MERLQRLKERTEAASYAEVIRSALRLFEALVEEHEKGSEFALSARAARPWPTRSSSELEKAVLVKPRSMWRDNGLHRA